MTAPGARLARAIHQRHRRVVAISALVCSVVRFGLTVARYNSVIGSNALFCCDRYSWSLDDLLRVSIFIYRILLLPTPVITWLITT